MRVRPVDCGPLEMGWTDWFAPMVVYAFDGGSGSLPLGVSSLRARAAPEKLPGRASGCP